jgi:hypothetical protein
MRFLISMVALLGLAVFADAQCSNGQCGVSSSRSFAGFSAGGCSSGSCSPSAGYAVMPSSPLTAAECKAGYLVTCSGEKLKPKYITAAGTIVYCAACESCPTCNVACPCNCTDCVCSTDAKFLSAKKPALKDTPVDAVTAAFNTLQTDAATLASATSAAAAAQTALTAATANAGTTATAQTTATTQVQTDANALIAAIQAEYLSTSLAKPKK